ncbi:MAG: hypothetical protein SOZ52_04185, partial [Pyramidobacter sp.]|nr:hypothetical protein [Pyramidobacter sp.]
DALSLMEQAIALSGGDVTREAVDKLLGGGSSSSIRQWISCCRTSPEEALPKLEAMFRSGAVPERFLSMLFVCVRNLWLDSRWGDKVLNKLALSQEEKQWLSTERGFLPQSSLERLMTQIASALPHVRRGLSNDVLCGLLTEWFFQGTAPSPDAFSALEAARESGFVLAPSVSKASSAAPRRAEPEDSSEISAPLPAQPEKIVPPASVFGDLAGAPEAAARGSFAQELDASCEKYPQAAVALRLADVFIDAEKSAVCALFSEEERMAFESLRNDRAIESARRVFLKVLPEVAAVELRCGNDREVFDSFLPEESGSVSESAPNGQTAAPSKEPLVHPRRARFDPETFVPEITSQPAEAEKTAEVKNQPLAEYVRGFMEGELLYCRPNGQPDSGEEEQQS